MYDKELALEILTQIYQATQTVLKRFDPIKSADDFISSISCFRTNDPLATVGGGFLDGYAGKANNCRTE